MHDKRERSVRKTDKLRRKTFSANYASANSVHANLPTETCRIVRVHKQTRLKKYFIGRTGSGYAAVSGELTSNFLSFFTVRKSENGLCRRRISLLEENIEFVCKTQALRGRALLKRGRKIRSKSEFKCGSTAQKVGGMARDGRRSRLAVRVGLAPCALVFSGLRPSIRE